MIRKASVPGRREAVSGGRRDCSAAGLAGAPGHGGGHDSPGLRWGGLSPCCGGSAAAGAAGPRVERSEAVAHAPHRLDGVAQGAQLLAQAQHGVVHRAVAPHVGLAPEGVQEVAAAEGPARAAQQEAQQAELVGGQVQRAPVQGRRVALGVQGQGPVGQGRLVTLAVGGEALAQQFLPAQEGPYPGQQLAIGEWFGQVVVRAQLQPQHPVGLLAAGGEHQHRGRRPRAGGLAYPPEHLQPVQAGQHPVQHHQVGPGPGVELEGRPAV